MTFSSFGVNRRDFACAAAAVTAAAGLQSAASPAAASERIRLGMIGVGNRGRQLLDSFRKHADAEIAAVCDVFAPYRDRAKSQLDGKPDTYADFRKLLERRDLDAVVVATPDHWHALQTIAACRAGKDVYVEKPLSITIVEGRKMVEAARRERRIVQVGTHRRSSTTYALLADMVREGAVGQVTVSRCYRLSNMSPRGIGTAPPTDPPPGLDWDLWLGPRPARPYQATIAPYKFRWWDLYSSQMANWGVHYLDAIRWVTGELAPKSVCAMGGKFAVEDDRTIPDTLEATFQFASGRLAVFGQYEASGAPTLAAGEIEFRGTLGAVYVDERGFTIRPETGGQFQSSQRRREPLDRQTLDGNLTDLHTRNFLDCIKSRRPPNADVEIGHRSTTMSLLANISLATAQRLEWDADRERFLHSSAANGLLHYEYRQPWSLE